MSTALAIVILAGLGVLLGLILRSIRSAVQRKGLYRPTEGKLLAGVCVGLALRSKLSPHQIRLLFFVSIVLPGSQLLLYLALWAFMPREAHVRAHTASV